MEPRALGAASPSPRAHPLLPQLHARVSGVGRAETQRLSGDASIPAARWREVIHTRQLKRKGWTDRWMDGWIDSQEQRPAKLGAAKGFCFLQTSILVAAKKVQSAFFFRGSSAVAPSPAPPSPAPGWLVPQRRSCGTQLFFTF